MRKNVLTRCVEIAIQKNNPESISEWGKYHHFSFIIQNNKIVAFSTNKAATPLQCYPPLSKCHAEPEAYFKARGIMDRNKNFECVNIRLDKQNNLRMSKPCKCCYSFLEKLGCKKVYFSTDIGFASITF